MAPYSLEGDRIMSDATQKRRLIIVFLFIPMIMLSLFVVYPTIRLFQLSFTNWDGINKGLEYIGVDNYIKIFTDAPDVWLSLKNNCIYFFVHLIAIPLEIFIAFILSRKIRGSQFLKSIIFMPYIINGVAVSYMFSMFYSPQGGALNELLGLFHIPTISFLGNPSIVNFSLSFVSLWRFSGMHVILFLAAIQSVPNEIIEAAKIDGANMLQQYLRVILPNIRSVVEIVLFLNVRGALQVFDIPFVMTGGGPGHASSTFTLYTIETAFKFSHFGLASAMATILMLLIIIVSFTQQKIIGGEE